MEASLDRNNIASPGHQNVLSEYLPLSMKNKNQEQSEMNEIPLPYVPMLLEKQ